MTDLNAKYRNEGWGKITDAALGIEPKDVESQAREVARWADVEIARLTRDLADAEVEITASEQHRAAVEAQIAAIEEDGTVEHNAAVDLRREVASLRVERNAMRAVVEAARKAAAIWREALSEARETMRVLESEEDQRALIALEDALAALPAKEPCEVCGDTGTIPARLFGESDYGDDHKRMAPAQPCPRCQPKGGE